MNRVVQLIGTVLTWVAMTGVVAAIPQPVISGEGHDTSAFNMSLEELLNVVIVTSARQEQAKSSSPRAVSVITAEELREGNYRTTPEALHDLVGVFIQETNYGGGSPIMRGMIGNKILLLIDGIRLNNAVFRLGPNQYLNTIDLNQIERIEVMRGTGSVLYGSDALGGLINIITKSATPGGAGGTPTSVSTRAFARYSSADESKIGRAEISAHGPRYGITGGASWKEFGNLRAGDGIGLQNYTGYDEWATDAKLSYVPFGGHRFDVTYQHVSQNDVPRSDRLISGSDVKRHWKPETRDLAAVKYQYTAQQSFIDDLEARVSYQRQVEQLERITSESPDIQRNHDDEVRSYGVGIELTSEIGERHSVVYGIDWYDDHVSSTRVDLNLISGTTSQKNGTFADGASQHSLGVFVQDEFRANDATTFSVGLRYSRFSLDAYADDEATGRINIENNPDAFTASAYATRCLHPHVDFVMGISQGFRAPNVDDATVLGSFGGGFEVPSPDLEPEQTLNYEAGLRAHTSTVVASAVFYLSNLENLIDRAPGVHKGLDFLDYNGNGVKDPGDDDVFQRDNIGQARIYGTEIEAVATPSPSWMVRGNVSWTWGEDRVNGEPLGRIPPINGMLAVRWNSRSHIWLEYLNRFATEQTRLSSGDVSDPRVPDGGTPGYLVSGVRGGLDAAHGLRLTIGVENIFNQAYRIHSSGIDAPGRNLILGLEWTL